MIVKTSTPYRYTERKTFWFTSKLIDIIDKVISNTYGKIFGEFQYHKHYTIKEMVENIISGL